MVPWVSDWGILSVCIRRRARRRGLFRDGPGQYYWPTIMDVATKWSLPFSVTKSTSSDTITDATLDRSPKSPLGHNVTDTNRSVKHTR